MTELEVERAVQLFATAFKHVEETGHALLRCADYPGGVDVSVSPPRLGIECEECKTWWTCPVPRPGEFNHWPHHLLEGKRFDHTAAGRRDFLAYGVTEALKKRGPSVVGPSKWDWIRRRDGVGW